MAKSAGESWFALPGDTLEEKIANAQRMAMNVKFMLRAIEHLSRSGERSFENEIAAICDVAIDMATDLDNGLQALDAEALEAKP